MKLNLISDPWIPVATPGGYRRIRPTEIISSAAKGPASPRPDFDAALYEIIIGLYQTVLAPKSEISWEGMFDKPPSEAELASKFAPFSNAFELTSSRQPFLQETGLEGAAEPISGLLIDTPGDATIDDNKDLFIRRRPEAFICGPCTALALFTLQSFSPAGGRGNMTSIRGGGPISTLILGDDLWETVWLNVLPAEAWTVGPGKPEPALFPWMNTPDPSKGKRSKLTSTEVAPGHVFWGMPRRILLGSPRGARQCVLCGELNWGFTEFISRPYGFDYHGSWIHPLSPTQEVKGTISARKGRSDLGAYRHWIGLVGNSDDGSRRPALSVHHYRSSPARRFAAPHARLRAAGYAMDNAKVEGWYEGTVGDVIPGDDGTRARVDHHAQHLIAATDVAARSLKDAYKGAWYGQLDVKGDLSFLSQALWTRTEGAFYSSLRKVASQSHVSMIERAAWFHRVVAETRRAFRERVQYTRLGDIDPKQVVQAEARLEAKLSKELPKVLDLSAEHTQGRMS
ncbi:MAG TPA: type I-E CRISPR-associated protein Cse1/CasA [Candidatus Thermoplasmatota archaeon]|nr:type I-E CRISPR-associated protein Cse1/CasA [Candidatus Thermoplasmatota archaeon]